MNLGWRVVLPLLVSLAGFAWTAPDAGAPEAGGAEAAAGSSAGQSGEEGGTDGER